MKHDKQYATHCVTEQTKKTLSDFQKLILKSIVALITGVPLFIVSMLGKNHVVSGENQIFWIVVGLIVLAVMIYSGGHFYKAAWTSFKAHNANMNTLIALATLPAWIYSILVAFWPSLVPQLAQVVYFDAPMTVIGLLVLGAALEIRAGENATRSIEQLNQLLPNTVNIIQENKTVSVPLETIKQQDELHVAAGGIIPVDGEIIHGESKIDVQHISGENQPITVKAGAKVYAGAKNLENSIIIRADRVGKNTALEQIIKIVKNAQNTKPAISAIADKIASVFAPAVLIIAFITLFIWFNFGPLPVIAYTLITFMAVLLIACPCALGLAAPISSTVGIAKASKSGIIFHNSNIFTDLANTKVVVLTFIPENTKAEISSIKKLGLKLVLFVNRDNAGKEFDASQFEYVHFDLSENEILSHIQSLSDKEKIAVIYPDEPIHPNLLKYKNVIHIVMGIESYQRKKIDIGILSTNFSSFIDALKIAKATLKNIKQNLSGAFLYNVIGIPIAAGILYPLTHALLSPILAGGLMAASSLLVILNANRLHLFNPRKQV